MIWKTGTEKGGLAPPFLFLNRDIASYVSTYTEFG
jgi:hypothetical protein